MTRKEFKKLKLGDTVVLNGMCRANAGIKCEVTYICDDRIWIKPINGKLISIGWSLEDWNEISYKAANILKEES